MIEWSEKVPEINCSTNIYRALPRPPGYNDLVQSKSYSPISQHLLPTSFILILKNGPDFPQPVNPTSFNWVPQSSGANCPTICRWHCFPARANRPSLGSLLSLCETDSPPTPLGLGMVSPQNFTLLAPGSLLFGLMPFFLKALPGARGLRFLTGSGGWWSWHIEWGHSIKGLTCQAKEEQFYTGGTGLLLWVILNSLSLLI